MALCGALDGDNSNTYFLVIDQLLTHQIPHFLNSDKVKCLPLPGHHVKRSICRARGDEMIALISVINRND